MRILVTYGSKRGGTEGVAITVATALNDAGLDAVVSAPEDIQSLDGFDAVILGGALYSQRWPLRFRSFVRRFARDLRGHAVWCFSSGPLDDSAEERDLPPTAQVRRLLDLIGARGHITFGGRLTRDARGFLARRLAKTHAGDWRNPDHIREWAWAIARELGGGPARRAPAPFVRQPETIVPA